MVRPDKKSPSRLEKKAPPRASKRTTGTSSPSNRKSALLEEAITQMNAGKYGRSSGVLKELLTVDPNNQEAKRLFATLQLRIGSLVTARTAFETMVQEAMDRQDYWLAESLLREYLAAGPRCVPFLERLGAVLEIKGDPDAAVREYAKAVEILVEDPDPERPNRARDIYQKIVELDPHSPAAYQLDSLLTRGKEGPSTGNAPEWERGGGPTLECSSLASKTEFETVEIPPFNPAPLNVTKAGPTRLPWEDEGQEVDVFPGQEDAAAVETGSEMSPVSPAGDSTGPATASLSDALAITEHTTLVSAPSESNEASRAACLVDGQGGGASENMLELSPADTVSTPQAQVGEAARDTGTDPAVAPSLQPDSPEEAPSTASGWQEILSKLFSSDPPPATKLEPDPGEITIPTSLTQSEPVESPSPSVEPEAATEAREGYAADRRVLASPMPWEQVEEQPIVVAPMDLRHGPPAQEDLPPPLAAMEALPTSNTIAAPMPWEQVEEQSILVPPQVEGEPPSPAGEQAGAASPPTAEPSSALATPMADAAPQTRDESVPFDGPAAVGEPPVRSPESPVGTELSDPDTELTPPTQDVNTQLITTILEQVDLKHPASAVRAERIQTNDAGSKKDVAVDETPTAPAEPAPIRELLDGALTHQDMTATPRDAQLLTDETTPMVATSAVAAESSGPAQSDLVPWDGSPSPPVELVHAPETSTPAFGGRPTGASPVDVPETVAPARTQEPEDKKPKSGFSFLPAVLRLVGVGTEKKLEPETTPEAETHAETSVAADPPAEPVVSAAAVEIAGPDTSASTEPFVESVAEEQSAQAPPVLESERLLPERDEALPQQVGSPADVQNETVSDTTLDSEPQCPSELKSGLQAEPESELEPHNQGDGTVASSEPAVSLVSEQIGTEVTIQRAVVETEEPVAQAPSDEARLEPAAVAVPEVDESVEEADTPVPPIVIEPPTRKKKDKRRKGKQAARSAEGPVFSVPAASQPSVMQPAAVAAGPSHDTSNSVSSPPPPVHHEPARVAPMQPTPETARPPAVAEPIPFRPVEPTPRSSPHERDVPVSKPKSSMKVGGMMRRMGWRVLSVVQACFSTAHALTVTAISLAALTIGVGVLGIGGLGVVWLGMEEKPNKLFQDLVGTVPQTSGDIKQSGYALLLGMGAANQKDPVQVGVGKQAAPGDLTSLETCFNAVQSTSLEKGTPSMSTLGSWFREAEPSAAFLQRAGTVGAWATEASPGLGHYRRWAGLPFEDGGYGELSAPDCANVVYLHRLHVADAFTQGLGPGIDLVEADLSHWRSVLRKARSLSAKMLAVAAINDDAHVLSGLFLSPDLDGQYLPRLSKAAVPLDQAEASLRWPMLSQFHVQKKVIEQSLKGEQAGERPWYAMGVAAMPVPRQRLLNDYADYYDALIKTSETSREKFAAPNLYARIHAPAQTTLDYVLNPINNVLDVRTGPAWEQYVGQVRETDALLRLVSLQAWLRKTAQEGTGDVKARLAKAGQNYYDPFTGFPMLVNSSKGRLYSVGMDGKDNDAAEGQDVSVAIPVLPTAGGTGAPSPSVVKR